MQVTLLYHDIMPAKVSNTKKNDYLQTLEYMLLKKIVTDVKAQQMSMPEAKKYAQDFLKLLPFSSSEDAQIKMHEYVRKYPVHAEMEDYIKAFNHEAKVNSIIDKMRKHLKNNNIDKALEEAKK